MSPFKKEKSQMYHVSSGLLGLVEKGIWIKDEMTHRKRRVWLQLFKYFLVSNLLLGVSSSGDSPSSVHIW